MQNLKCGFGISRNDFVQLQFIMINLSDHSFKVNKRSGTDTIRSTSSPQHQWERLTNTVKQPIREQTASHSFPKRWELCYVSLKTLLQQGISEPEFYGDLVYRFRKNVGKSNFSEQFRKLINRYKRIGYNLDIMRQTACLVVNPIIVDGYASLFNCTTAVRASDSMTASS